MKQFSPKDLPDLSIWVSANNSFIGKDGGRYLRDKTGNDNHLKVTDFDHTGANNMIQKLWNKYITSDPILTGMILLISLFIIIVIAIAVWLI